jgi:UDP-N-acetylglucosamine 1-carboxyvinyltransferase
MDVLAIRRAGPLSGEVAVSGSKNASLPMMAAAILAHERVDLVGVPALFDVRTLARVLAGVGVECRFEKPGRLCLQTVDPSPTTAGYRLVRRMRASFCVLGPLVARRGTARVAMPGGCRLGDRPVDLHLHGLASLGAKLRVERGYVVAEAKRLRGALVDLSGPRGPTVTGTANVLSAAVLARGTSVITGAAREPEIVELGRMLVRMGARIDGLGTSTLEVAGVDGLRGCRWPVMGDRIEAATWLISAAASGGRLRVTGVPHGQLQSVLEVLDQCGASLRADGDGVSLVSRGRPRPVTVSARPYPGFPTDVQPLLSAWLAIGDGQSIVRDEVFPARFLHLAELARMGARVGRQGNSAVIRGVDRLEGAEVAAHDLRCGAALVVAGIAAVCGTRIHAAEHLDRGYESLTTKLAGAGVEVERIRSRDRAGSRARSSRR